MPIKTAALLAAAILLSFGAADAVSAGAKPKFERSKPHVNVGTIGQTGSPAAGNLASPVGPATPTTRPAARNF